jgi:uncharacterized membrane protein
MPSARVLIAGESWMTHSIHTKGFDSFTTTEYVEGVGPLRDALEAGGCAVAYQPAHVAMRDFPSDADALGAYDVVILSDIGANSLLLHPETFTSSVPHPHRLRALAEWVRAGGGLLMIGGYLTFAGIEGKGRWHGTAVEDVLPVEISAVDDRVEEPSGVQPAVLARHPVLDGIDEPWPALLGYNRTVADLDAQVLVTVGADPLLALGRAGAGRTAVFTSDCAPHWAPPPFVGWAHYARLWQQLVGWLAES